MLFRASLLVVGRHSETEPATEREPSSFNVCEVVRQTVSPANPPQGRQAPRPPLIKDIETTTLYRMVSPDQIVATQRTASFLVANPNQDPLKAAQIERLQGRAVDVRTYSVVYTRVRRVGAGVGPQEGQAGQGTEVT